MNILILNWRDIKNPASGGAEILTHEIAKRLVKKSHKIIQISAGFPNCKKKEIIDGVQIIRLGKWWSVHFLAFFYYFFNLRKNIDIVIDEVHWYPFFSKLYAPKKTILLACEVAEKLFFNLFPYPFAILGRLVEKIYLLLYKNTPTLVISPSTKEDLIKEGFKAKDITILPMGLNIPQNTKIYPKEKKPTIIYLGRLCKQKGIEDALTAFEKVKKEIPNSVLWIVGAGEKFYVKKLKDIAKQISDDIIFFGFVSEKEKFKLLSKAHVLIVPSVHEGWGLIVPEAGFVETPAVVYNVGGLRDLVEKGQNGEIVEKTPEAMGQAIKKLLNDSVKYSKLRKGAREKAEIYNWDNTVEKLMQVFYKQL